MAPPAQAAAAAAGGSCDVAVAGDGAARSRAGSAADENAPACDGDAGSEARRQADAEVLLGALTAQFDDIKTALSLQLESTLKLVAERLGSSAPLASSSAAAVPASARLLAPVLASSADSSADEIAVLGSSSFTSGEPGMAATSVTSGDKEGAEKPAPPTAAGDARCSESSLAFINVMDADENPLPSKRDSNRGHRGKASGGDKTAFSSASRGRASEEVNEATNRSSVNSLSPSQATSQRASNSSRHSQATNRSSVNSLSPSQATSQRASNSSRHSQATNRSSVNSLSPSQATSQRASNSSRHSQYSVQSEGSCMSVTEVHPAPPQLPDTVPEPAEPMTTVDVAQKAVKRLMFAQAPSINDAEPEHSFSESEEEEDEEIFQLLPRWQAQGNGQNHGVKQDSRRTSIEMREDLSHQRSHHDYTDSETREEVRKLKCVLVPHSPLRGIWDLCSLCLVVWDMVVIPLQFFDPADTLFSVFMAWTVRLFWTCDMAVSCMTGYVRSNGVIEVRVPKIIVKYARSWFLVDLVIVSSDWMEVFLSGSEDNNLSMVRFGKTSRAVRIIRMLRLVRLFRVRELFMLVMERVRSERLIILAHIFQLMLALVAWSHMTACLWYGIGGASDGAGWVSVFFVEEENHSIAYRYLSSMHWALSQLTGGMDEIRAHNTGERAYCIVMFLVAFVMAAVFVSHLTSSMTQLNMMSSRQVLQLAALRRFLFENSISHLLASRVVRSAQSSFSHSLLHTPEDSVELLEYVSVPLRVELHFELYAPLFTQHPFFSRYIVQCPTVMRRVCHHAVTTAIFTKGDIVFSVGELPLQPVMYFSCSGNFDYRCSSLPESETDICTGQWLSESALWTQWRHRGTLQARDQSRLCVISSLEFQDIVLQFKHGPFDPKTYAASYVARMNQLKMVSDLPLEEVDLPGQRRQARLKSLIQVMPFLHQNDQKFGGVVSSGSITSRFSR
eukprot:TRINITY_DN3615_c0_g1_i5.p1 TRINITY_DN3615_c0_g1~~TRINITY_DN3615_c0_g1_i5.p1  ORF type:complete len:957 (+),score=213.85 TRINITY_DN3615_c0_g1_i5:116-2986(+)